MDFKVGDKVKIIHGKFKGEVGFVTDHKYLPRGIGYIAVELDSSCSITIKKECLEKIEEPKTVSRRIHDCGFLIGNYCNICETEERLKNSESISSSNSQEYHPSRRDYLIGKIITSHGGPMFSDPIMNAEKLVTFVNALIAELDKTEKK